MPDTSPSQFDATRPSPDANEVFKLDWRTDLGCFALGLAGLGSQTYLLRESLVSLGGNEMSIGLGLATWLSGIALGAVLSRMLKRNHAKHAMGIVVSLLAPVGLLEFVVARAGYALMNTAKGEVVGLADSLLHSIAVFALPGVLVGTGFVAFVSFVGSRRSPDDTSIGRLYMFESLGSLVAGILITWTLLPCTTPYVGYCLVLTLALLLWLPAARSHHIAGHRLLLVEAAILAGFCVSPVARHVESTLQQVRFASQLPRALVLDWTETPYSQLVVSQGETHALFRSGSYTFSFPDPFDDEARAHPLMLLCQIPRRVLILGTFEPGMLQYMLKHPVESIEWVSIDGRAHAFLSEHLDIASRNAFADPRVHIRFEDPRRWLQHSSERFDLILQLDHEPVTLMLARNSTLEFMQLLGARLAPGGTFVLRFASGPNVQVGQRVRLGASLYATLHAAFPFVRAIPDPLNVIIAGKTAQAVTVDHDTLARRWNTHPIQTEVVTLGTLDDLFPPERIVALNRELADAAHTAIVSTDDRPVAFVHALALRNQLANAGNALPLADSLSNARWVYVLAILPGLLLLTTTVLWSVRRRVLNSVMHTVAVVGATGMALDLLLLFSFQTYVGALYSEIGMLNGVFMLGLAIGGYLGRRSAAVLRAQLLTLGATLLPLLFWAAVHRAQPARAGIIVLHSALLLLSGIATGFVFPVAANAMLRLGRTPRAAAGSVEMADHLGAAVAALVTCVVLVPAAGLVNTVVLLLLVQLIGLALSATALRSRP